MKLQSYKLTKKNEFKIQDFLISNQLKRGEYTPLIRRKTNDPEFEILVFKLKDYEQSLAKGDNKGNNKLLNLSQVTLCVNFKNQQTITCGYYGVFRR